MTIEERIFDFADMLVAYSDGAIRLVKNEKDDTDEKDLEAAEFLKLNNKRLGRDLKLYAFIKEVASEQQMVLMLLEELLIPVKALHTSYSQGSKILKKWGEGIFGDNADNWKELF